MIRATGRHLAGFLTVGWLTSAGWWRRLGLYRGAMVSISLLLFLVGLFALLAGAGWRLQQVEERRALVLRVYLKDGVTPAAVSALQERLQADPGVGSVRHLSKEEALADGRNRLFVSDITKVIGENPLPETLVVRVIRPADLARVADQAAADPAADPVLPTSYDAGTAERFRELLLITTAFSALVIVIVGVVAIVVAASSARGAINPRRDELRILYRMGAPRWVVSLPVAIEGAAVGILAGLLATGLTVVAAALTEHSVLAGAVSRTYGFGPAGALALTPALVLAGALVGGFAAATVAAAVARR